MLQVPSYLPPGVRFNDCLFTEPSPLHAWRPPACAGLLIVLARNPQWGPKPVQPIYIGEFGNDAARGSALPSHVRRDDLLVSVLPMPYSTAAQRRALCNELIAAYNPACQVNGAAVSAADLANKVDELQAQVLSLVTHLGKMFEPQPVGPRKPIGFLPQVTESGS